MTYVCNQIFTLFIFNNVLSSVFTISIVYKYSALGWSDMNRIEWARNK